MGLGVNITTEEEQGIKIIHIEGKFDAIATPIIESKIGNILDKSEKVLLDFSKVSYLSSAGMRLLLSLTKKMRAKGGDIGFFSIGDEVMEILKVAGFERVLHIFTNKKQALQAFQKS